MVLKGGHADALCIVGKVIIAPYGIESAGTRGDGGKKCVIIAPYGIERSILLHMSVCVSVIIAPYGIERDWRSMSLSILLML